MAITVFGGQEKRGLLIGLSTDIKPNPLADSWSFIEINTGRIFYSEGGQWKENQREEAGTITFASSKNATIVFTSPFNTVPKITFSNNDAAISVNYKSSVTVNGFTMKFLSPFTGTVDWYAKQRP